MPHVECEQRGNGKNYRGKSSSGKCTQVGIDLGMWPPFAVIDVREIPPLRRFGWAVRSCSFFRLNRFSRRSLFLDGGPRSGCPGNPPFISSRGRGLLDKSNGLCSPTFRR
uniref:Uncharacterized protein n=1 Tax=uncultured marine microorganism HF4000_APKG2M17 TaxID=455548 RepID=B3T6U4_9ZZZZ|nr:hypothetical protein ALOHA_HF4000APKG2M17ctg1g25 [uncultured marine microorganism HF4000_APKG2M17]